MKKQKTMKLSPFMQWVKKQLKNNTKKELIEKVLLWIDMNAQQTLQEWDRYNDLYEELAEVRIELEETQEALRRCRNQLLSYKNYEKELVITKIERNMNEWFLESAESALRMYENMNPYTFFIHKYFK